jgi:hypothetical protein
MTQYGIKLVWPGWNNDTVMGFSDDGYNRWRESIQPGTRMLLYETEDRSPGTTFRGTKSISGEIEVTGTFKDGEKYPAPTKQHHHLVPVKLLRPRRGGDKSPSIAFGNSLATTVGIDAKHGRHSAKKSTSV